MPIIKSYEDSMEVYLVTNPPDIKKILGLAFQNAIKRVQQPNQAKEVTSSVIENAWRHKHHSFFEQVNLTFYAVGITRALAAQITRQRTFKYSSSSQHYQDYSDYTYAVHRDYVKNKNVRSAIYTAHTEYEHLINDGCPRSEARMVLPMAAVCNLMITADMRNLMYFLELRLNKRNVYEMRLFAKIIHNICKGVFTELFSLVSVPEPGEWEMKLNKNTEL